MSSLIDAKHEGAKKMLNAVKTHMFDEVYFE